MNCTADGYQWPDHANRVVTTRATTDAEKAIYGAGVTATPNI